MSNIVSYDKYHTLKNYGYSIDANGECPYWLTKEYTPNIVYDSENEHGFVVGWPNDWSLVRVIRLPYDHTWYTYDLFVAKYCEILIYWPGFGVVSDDWDGEEVLLRNGSYATASRWDHLGKPDDVIGLRFKPEVELTPMNETSTIAETFKLTSEDMSKLNDIIKSESSDDFKYAIAELLVHRRILVNTFKRILRLNDEYDVRLIKSMAYFDLHIVGESL
jgi:hypothetical protein